MHITGIVHSTLGCAPIQQTDTHADLPMMSMILLFPATGLVS